MAHTRSIFIYLTLLMVIMTKSLEMPSTNLPTIITKSRTLTKENNVIIPNELSKKYQNIPVKTIANANNEKKLWYMQIFPIYPKELLKFFSLSMMMFWIVFVFTMTRDTKDTLIVTNCGAEAIAFLKVYGVVPAAAGFMILYAKLANILAPRVCE